jgi:hypothetical protein
MRYEVWERTDGGGALCPAGGKGMNPQRYALSTASRTLAWVFDANSWDEAMDLFLERRFAWPPGTYTKIQRQRDLPRFKLTPYLQVAKGIARYPVGIPRSV